MRRICNILLARRAAASGSAIEELLCVLLLIGLTLFSQVPLPLLFPVRDGYSSDRDLCIMLIYRKKDIYRDAIFMIGSVTKLTLYAVSLAAAHKDEVEKRDALLKDRFSDHRFDAPRVRCSYRRYLTQQRVSP